MAACTVVSLQFDDACGTIIGDPQELAKGQIVNSGPSNSPIFIRWFRDNPWWGVGGVLLGAAGIVLTIGIYYVTKRERRLVYTIDPTRITIVNSKDAPSQLKVINGDQTIPGDVSATQIVLWNRGFESIRMET